MTSSASWIDSAGLQGRPGTSSPIKWAGIAPYALPLRRPWASARGRWSVRRGWLVAIETAEGVRGYGDCAPLKDAGTEAPAAAYARLCPGLANLRGQDIGSALSLLDGWRDSPSARCSVECALLDILAQIAGASLARWLRPGAAAVVPVNAALGAMSSGIETRVQRALAAGFRVLKLKLGPGSGDIEALHALAARLPCDAALRLDANGSWGEAGAREAFTVLRDLPVESLEEPLSSPSGDALQRLQASVPWPLALDESLPGWPLAELLASPPVRRLVLKPAALGGILPALRLAERAKSVGVDSVVTTVVDSVVGVRACLHLAAAVGGSLAHGLATSEWLREDVGRPPALHRGCMRLEDSLGLGFSPSSHLRFEAIR